MNRTQRITSDWLLQSGLTGGELLLEGLLRRGFLAFRDDEGVWLGTGSHPADLVAVRLVAGLEVEEVPAHKERMARVRSSSPGVPAMDSALAVVALPENHLGSKPGHWTGCGLGQYVKETWRAYRTMAWGAKLPTCPLGDVISEKYPPDVPNALDLGVALLVKALPVVRVATAACCDGHGKEPAVIYFNFEWDGCWAKATFEVLREATPSSRWDWGERSLRIASPGGYSDAEVLGVLHDIQHFARRLLDRNVIDKIGRARRKTLDAFGKHAKGGPGVGRFTEEARRCLAESFA